MGMAVSILQLHKYEGKRFMPRRRLRNFPENKRRAPGLVNIVFKVLPNGVKFPDPMPENSYWWPDVKFLPQSDDTLIISVGAFKSRQGMCPLVAHNRVHGLIYRTSILGDRLSCYVYKGTCTSACPNLSVHPDGIDVGFAGCGYVNLLDLENQDILTRSKDVRNNNFKYTDCSPNGSYLAVVAKCSRVIELHVLIIERSMFIRQGNVDLHTICPEFYGIRNRVDYFECRFSPDSRYLAVGSSHGHLLVTPRSALNTYCNVIPGVFNVNDVKLATERAFDFDPRYCHKFLAFGSETNEIYIIDTGKQDVFAERKLEELEGEICSVKYGPRNCGLAVATTTSVIYMCDTDTLDVLYTLNGAEQGTASMVMTNDVYPAIIRTCFSTTGENLAVTSTDGFCRIWQLAPILNLMELCRYAIMRSCSVRNFEHLPLPPKIIMYLLDWPISEDMPVITPPQE